MPFVNIYIYNGAEPEPPEHPNDFEHYSPVEYRDREAHDQRQHIWIKIQLKILLD